MAAGTAAPLNRHVPTKSKVRVCSETSRSIRSLPDWRRELSGLYQVNAQVPAASVPEPPVPLYLKATLPDGTDCPEQHGDRGHRDGAK